MPGTHSREQRRIDLLKGLFSSPAHVRVGIGDDAAVIAGDPRDHAYSVDVAVEGQHFERAWLSPHDIAFRAFMGAASDLAAMGALPSHALCAWTLPPDVDDEAVSALGEGTASAANQCRLPVVGGNLSGGTLCTLTTTVVGTLDGPAVRRQGGRPGDALFVTGPLGGARLGLELLRSGHVSADDPFARAFCAPRARLDLSQRLRETACCAIDLSDGLLPDLQQLCAASRVGARVELERLPHLPGLESRAKQTGLDARTCLLAGGEEYELLFASRADALPWATRIGTLCDADLGLVVVDAAGHPCNLPEEFLHF